MHAPMSKKLFLSLLGITSLSAFSWVVATQGPLAPTKVTVTRVMEGPLVSQVFGIGTVEARRRYAMGPTAPGRIAEILVDEGDHVAQGAVLARMDAVDLRERLRSATLASSKAEHQVKAASAQLQEAKSRAALAATTYQRYREMRDENFVSLEALEAKRYEETAARAAVEAAAQALLAARNDLARSHVDVAGLNKQLEQLTLLSPVDGVVIARLAEPGATVVAGQAVVELVDPASLWVSAHIDQRQAGWVREGQPVDIVLRSQPQTLHPGRVSRLDWISDAVTEERKLHISFDNLETAPSLGELVEVTVHQQPIEHATWLPAGAIRRGEGNTVVWAVGTEGVEFHPVKSGITTLDGKTQLLSELPPNLAIIVHTQQPLGEGDQVRVVDSLLAPRP